jgi:hypothetical protein
VVTPRTGRPFHRPKGSPNKHIRGVREDGGRYAIALADLYISRGMTPAKAFLRAMLQLEFLAKKVECSGRLSNKMNAALEMFGGQIVSYEIGYSGNRDMNYIDEKRIQGINRLRKKAQRYGTEAGDIEYRITMAKMFMYFIFAKDIEGCAARVLKLSREIGEEQMAAALVEAMRARAMQIGEESPIE